MSSRTYNGVAWHVLETGSLPGCQKQCTGTKPTWSLSRDSNKDTSSPATESDSLRIEKKDRAGSPEAGSADRLYITLCHQHCFFLCCAVKGGDEMFCVPIDHSQPMPEGNTMVTSIEYTVSILPSLDGGQCVSFDGLTRSCLCLACCRSESRYSVCVFILTAYRTAGQLSESEGWSVLNSLQMLSINMDNLLDNVGSEHQRRTLDSRSNNFLPIASTHRALSSAPLQPCIHHSHRMHDLVGPIRTVKGRPQSGKH